MWLLASAALAGDPAVDGRFVLADPASTEALRSAAVDAAITDLPMIVRPFARPLADSAAHLCDAVTLDLAPDRLSVACNADPAMIRMRSGELTVTGPDGRRYDIGLEVAPDAVLVSWEGREGTLRTWYRPHPDGLLVTRELTSRHLQRPIAWTAAYLRVE